MESERTTERITVNLIDAASNALAEAAALTQDSKTDTVNRALQVYLLMTKHQHDGGTILLRDKDGVVERVRLL